MNGPTGQEYLSGLAHSNSSENRSSAAQIRVLTDLANQLLTKIGKLEDRVEILESDYASRYGYLPTTKEK